MEKIKEKINLFCESNFHDYNLLEEVLEEHKALKSREKREIEPFMYVIYRGKFDSLVQSASYSEAISWLEKTRNHTRYEKELPGNKKMIIIKGIKTYLLEYLNQNEQNLFNMAEELHMELRSVGIKRIENEEIYLEIMALKNSIACDSLKTKVSLTLSRDIKPNKQNPIIVQTNDFIATIEYENNQREMTEVSSDAHVRKSFDKEGQLRLTNWTIEFNKYINCDKRIKIDQDYYISILDESICQAVNAFIDYYRQETGEYWLEKIYPFMLSNKGIEYLADETVFRSVPYLNDGIFRVSAQQETVEIIDEVNVDNIPLYELLLLDAKSYLLSQNFREAVLSLNSAFENYVYTIVCPLIVRHSEYVLEEKFYTTIPNYENFHLKNFMTQEEYQEAIRQELITPEVMSIYKIVNTFLFNYCDELKSIISKRKMKKMINSIRKNRNDFIHGNAEVASTSHREVYSQIQCFQEFKEVIKELD